ncbi:unnamed protein product [Durusdinium trenchii]|uniref:Uncharacterized protein n=1 Tax=Durusdinium trenchii TaxID=1381693 RepID=A0ABP0PK00_9DINO
MAVPNRSCLGNALAPTTTGLSRCSGSHWTLLYSWGCFSIGGWLRKTHPSRFMDTALALLSGISMVSLSAWRSSCAFSGSLAVLKMEGQAEAA